MTDSGIGISCTSLTTVIVPSGGTGTSSVAIRSMNFSIGIYRCWRCDNLRIFSRILNSTYPQIIDPASNTYTQTLEPPADPWHNKIDHIIPFALITSVIINSISHHIKHTSSFHKHKHKVPIYLLDHPCICTLCSGSIYILSFFTFLSFIFHRWLWPKRHTNWVP